jgi:hypothetical protein
MNDLLECGSAPQPIAITRCRELLGDEALALSDETSRRSANMRRQWRTK